MITALLVAGLFAPDAGIDISSLGSIKVAALRLAAQQLAIELEAIRSVPSSKHTIQIVDVGGQYKMIVEAGDSTVRGGGGDAGVPVTSGRSTMTVMLRRRRLGPERPTTPRVQVCRGSDCSSATWPWDVTRSGSARARARADVLLGSAPGRVVFHVSVAGETLHAPVVMR